MATKVVFKIEEDGEILAVFPHSPEGDYRMTCYAHRGQHSCCSHLYALRLKNAKPEQYQSLLQELKSIGYNDLVVLKRLPNYSQL